MKQFYAFKNADSKTEAELSLYDEIGFWGTNAKDFAQALKQITAPKLTIRINSPGGSVIDGFAIYNLLRAHAAVKTVMIDGMAASIASVIAMAGDKIVMPANTLFFLHEPLVGMNGNAEELRKMAVDLEKMSESILNIYVARTKSSPVAIKALMTDETWLTAKESLAMGFCDEVIPEHRAAASYKAADYFSATAVTKIEAAQKITLPSANPAGGLENTPKKETMTKEEQDALNAANSRVTSLEGEKAGHATALTQAKTQAHQEATAAVKKDEKARKDGILALQTKYNKDGDLNAIAVTALAGETTVAEFQMQVMDLINDRPAKAAIKPTGAGAAKDGDTEFVTKYKACKTDAERRACVRANRAEARKALSAGQIAE